MNNIFFNEVNIKPFNGEPSIIDKFNFTKNEDSKEKLRDYFIGDTLSLSQINDMHLVLTFLRSNILLFERIYITNVDNFYIKEYIQSKHPPFQVKSKVVSNLYLYLFKRKRRKFNTLLSGVKKLLLVLNNIYSIYTQVYPQDLPVDIKRKINTFLKFYAELKLFDFRSDMILADSISISSLLSIDNQLRCKNSEKVLNVLNDVYSFEALLSIVHASIKYGLTIPKISETNEILIKNMFHPLVKECMQNDFHSSDDKNITILTGPNMSGKSTLLKTLSLIVYLGHKGLPVPASNVVLPYYNEILVFLNNKDDINKKESYFLSEVKNVVRVVNSLNLGNRCFVIFDELFKGTNYSDALQCSKTICQVFRQHKLSYFFISTHLTELINEFEENYFDKKHLDASLKDNAPLFHYKLKDGFSDLKIGFLLLKKNLPIKNIYSIQSSKNQKA